MKRVWFVLLFLSALFGTLTVQSKMGCLSNTKKLKQRFDTKAYYPVECYCPCDYYHKRTSRDQCDECGHFHDPKPFIMVTAYDPGTVPNAPRHLAETNVGQASARHAVDILIQRYQKRHKTALD